MVGVIHRHGVEGRGVHLGNSEGVGDVPEALGIGVDLIPLVVDGGVSVIDLEELGLRDGGEVFGGDGVIEVGMVELGDHGTADAL